MTYADSRTIRFPSVEGEQHLYKRIYTTMMIKQINNEKILLLVVLHMVNHQSEATLICKTFSLACIRSLQPLPLILDQSTQPSEDLDQLVWFDADDGEAPQDGDDEEDEKEDQLDDYTAIEGLESHQDISELVWMDAGTDGEDKDDFHVHRIAVSESSWQTAAGSSSSNSLLLEALLPDKNMDGRPSTVGPATASSVEVLNASTTLTVDGAFLAASTASDSTVSASIAASGLSHPSDASSRRRSSLTTLG
jgi:hypothetical protein